MHEEAKSSDSMPHGRFDDGDRADQRYAEGDRNTRALDKGLDGLRRSGFGPGAGTGAGAGQNLAPPPEATHSIGHRRAGDASSVTESESGYDASGASTGGDGDGRISPHPELVAGEAVLRRAEEALAEAEARAREVHAMEANRLRARAEAGAKEGAGAGGDQADAVPADAATDLREVASLGGVSRRSSIESIDSGDENGDGGRAEEDDEEESFHSSRDDEEDLDSSRGMMAMPPGDPHAVLPETSDSNGGDSLPIDEGDDRGHIESESGAEVDPTPGRLTARDAAIATLRARGDAILRGGVLTPASQRQDQDQDYTSDSIQSHDTSQADRNVDRDSYTNDTESASELAHGQPGPGPGPAATPVGSRTGGGSGGENDDAYEAGDCSYDVESESAPHEGEGVQGSPVETDRREQVGERDVRRSGDTDASGDDT